MKKIDTPCAINTSPAKKRSCYTFKSLFRSIARNPQQVYFESRGKCVKKLLRYNGYPNKVIISDLTRWICWLAICFYCVLVYLILDGLLFYWLLVQALKLIKVFYFVQVLLYPEEGWARNASSSYLSIKICSWWPNLCVIEEKSGTKR